MNLRYRIPEISALQVLSAITEKDGHLYLYLDPEDLSRDYLVNQTLQDDCPMFFQAMRVLGEEIVPGSISDALFHAFVYVDFSGIFDRTPTGRTLELQKKAEKLFRPEGLWIDLGKGYEQYFAFERSASMSRNCKLSFVRADLCKPLRQRMMLNMYIGKCQLSKLYAYNGLMFTGGRRVEIPEMMDEKHIILIDNPKDIIKNVKTITVKDDGTKNSVRVYTRVEETADIKITEFDGEGLVSPDLAYILDSVKEENHPHHSFQIRMPYIKGVVHEVDFKTLFAELEVTQIQDIFGQLHSVWDIDMILTKSMFKGFGWMKENGISWGEYLRRCNQYEHGLYISGMDSLERRSVTELNYQFLVTANITQEEFRPADLPMGWKKAPPADRQWLTKATEDAYWSYVGDMDARQSYFTKIANDPELELNSRKKNQAKLVEKNPLFLGEPIFSKELQDKAENILTKYENANLLVAGDNRYLSDDLMRLLAYIVKPTSESAHLTLMAECLQGAVFYAPQPAYSPNDTYLLLRNPHIARNEEVTAKALEKPGPIRKKYLSHLHYVVMVDSHSLVPERLGGADYDGDMIKTISDPLLNRCVARNFSGSFENHSHLPLLKIPAAEPLQQDAQDWQARFAVVKSTFSSRVGQISNAALRRSIFAYDENMEDGPTKEHCRQETETLAILTGLEIDSAKSGIKPDLSAYLGSRKNVKSLFLKFRNINKQHDSAKWYKPPLHQQRTAFFDSVDWSMVSSNLEKVPYYAKLLEENTKGIELKLARDEELFTFAIEPGWKDKLDPALMKRVEALVTDYEEALRRCRYTMRSSQYMTRKTDVQRILFSRNQEDQYTVEELYHLFDHVSPYDIRRMRFALSEGQWQFTPAEERINALVMRHMIGTDSRCWDLFFDFRNGGYRLLGDIICDFDDMYRSMGIRKNLLDKKGDSKDLQAMLNGIFGNPNYKEELGRRFWYRLNPPGRKVHLSYSEVAKCMVALGKRQLAIEIMPSVLLDLTIDTRPKKKWRLLRCAE